MLSKTQLERYADVLLWGMRTARTGKYVRNDIVLVRFDLAATALAEILQGRLLDMGMNPILRMVSTPKMESNFFGKANTKQLAFIPPGEKKLYQNLNGNIYLHAPESITHLSHIDPKRIGKTVIAIKPLRDILWSREDEGRFGWTLCLLPTHELARHAGLSINQYTSQIVKACYLNKKDPVAEWKSIYRDAIEIKRWIDGLKIKSLHVESKNIDLKITQGEKRRWIGVSGHNIPSFEIFMSPDWKGTEGVYLADQPSFRNGNLVKSVRLEFKKGRAVKITARKGQNFVRQQLSVDKGACKVGEFSLTDKRFSKIDRFMASTLYDENYGGKNGNCHLAVGMSYSDTFDGDPTTLTPEKKRRLGFNDSAIHWDLVNTEKKMVTAYLKGNKKVIIYENGMFKY